MFKIGIPFIIILMLSASQASAGTISSSDLINKAKEYDNKEIAYKGEIIGDMMVRGQYAWVNLNDGINAIGIWANKAMLKDVIYTGNFMSAGDTIEVAGIFHRACLEHGGDLDIHARSIHIISPGYPLSNQIDHNKIKAVFTLSLILAVIALLSKKW
jgi:hypothetical protein